MTALTPQQMRELAEDNDAANTVTMGLTLLQRRNLAGESARALRAAADQLEAVQAWNQRDRGMFASVVLSRILTADTAP